MTLTMVDLYFRVRRKPKEGSLAEAIRCHAQACGFVAFTFDVHPDDVARAVKDQLYGWERAPVPSPSDPMS